MRIAHGTLLIQSVLLLAIPIIGIGFLSSPAASPLAESAPSEKQQIAVFTVPLLTQSEDWIGWYLDPTDTILVPWAEYGTPEPIRDTAIASFLARGLVLLDTVPFPDDNRQRAELLISAFPGFSPEDTSSLCTETACDVFFCDLDGQPPRDIVAFNHTMGSAGCYSLDVAVRQTTTITFQSLGGCRRGLLNMLARVEGLGTDSVFWDQSGYKDNFVLVDGIKRPYLLLHNNLDWPNSEGVMALMCDFPVPYFWDGKRLCWDGDAARFFYGRLQNVLEFLDPADSAVIASSIAKLRR